MVGSATEPSQDWRCSLPAPCFCPGFSEPASSLPWLEMWLKMWFTALNSLYRLGIQMGMPSLGATCRRTASWSGNTVTFPSAVRTGPGPLPFSQPHCPSPLAHLLCHAISWGFTAVWFWLCSCQIFGKVGPCWGGASVTEQGSGGNTLGQTFSSHARERTWEEIIITQFLWTHRLAGMFLKKHRV